MKTARIEPGVTGWITTALGQRAWSMRLNNGTYATVSGRIYRDEHVKSFAPATRN